MKRLPAIFIALSLIALLSTSLEAQRQQDRPGQSTFYDNFWYGGNVALQLGTGFFVTSFEPMLGYKLDKKGIFSAGPRLSIEYTSITYFDGFGRRLDRLNGFNYGGGLFARAKIYRGFFAHVEYEKLNVKVAQTNQIGNAIIIDNEVQFERTWRDNYFVGGGVIQGNERVGFELAILINLKDDIRFNSDPIEYRTGFVVNF